MADDELHQRVHAMQEFLLRFMTSGDEGDELPISNAEDDLDGVATGINILMPDLRRELSEQRRLRGDLDQVFRTLTDAILVVKVNGQIESANDATASLFGYSAAELIGANLKLLYADANGLLDALSNVSAGTVLNSEERQCLARDGEFVDVAISFSNMPSGNGNEGRILWVARDMREIRRLLQQAKTAAADRQRADELESAYAQIEQTLAELRSTQQHLVQAQKLDAIGRLAGGLAHEFNNLFLVILSYTSFLKNSLAPSHAGHEDVDEINVATRRAAELSQHLLTVSRRQINKPEVFDLSDLLRTAKTTLRRVVGSHLDWHLDCAAASLPVFVDRAQFEQVLTNLCLNAADAMPDGGTLTLRTIDLPEGRGEIGPRCVAFQIEDTGVGMDDETCSRVFEPFFTTKERERGTGLGLSICYGIVKQSRGDIWVSSTEGKGSRFEIVLPRSEERIEAASEELRTLQDYASVKILLAEDQVDVRKVMVRILAGMGYEVIEACDGQEAADIFTDDDTINLVVTDMVMPRLSGEGLAKIVRQARPEVPIVFVSGYADRYPDLTLENGRSAIISKPFKAEELARCLAEVLGSDSPAAH